jgi:GAF domain-containing protein
VTDQPNDDGGSAPRTDREQRLAELFVTLADTLVDDYDVVDLLDQVVTACVDLLGVTAAGMLLHDQRGNLAVIASSSEETRLLEMFQLQNNEGPCLDCVRTGRPVTSADLAHEHARWPLFVPSALAAGFRSVAAVPLRLRAEIIGGLNLFDEQAKLVDTSDQLLAQALADVATIGILNRQSAHRRSVVAEQLQHALNSRIVIEQAKGMTAERLGLDMGRAFVAMRRVARTHNLQLTEVARQIIEGELPASMFESQ